MHVMMIDNVENVIILTCVQCNNWYLLHTYSVSTVVQVVTSVVVVPAVASLPRRVQRFPEGMCPGLTDKILDSLLRRG